MLRRPKALVGSNVNCHPNRFVQLLADLFILSVCTIASRSYSREERDEMVGFLALRLCNLNAH